MREMGCVVQYFRFGFNEFTMYIDALIYVISVFTLSVFTLIELLWCQLTICYMTWRDVMWRVVMMVLMMMSCMLPGRYEWMVDRPVNRWVPHAKYLPIKKQTRALTKTTNRENPYKRRKHGSVRKMNIDKHTWVSDARRTLVTLFSDLSFPPLPWFPSFLLRDFSLASSLCVISSCATMESLSAVKWTVYSTTASYFFRKLWSSPKSWAPNQS